jgi:hypothetical protein
MVFFLGMGKKNNKLQAGDLSALEKAILLLEKPRLDSWNTPGPTGELVKVDGPRWGAYSFFETRHVAPPKILGAGMFADVTEPEQYVPIALAIGEAVLEKVYDAPKVTTGLTLVFNAEYRTLVGKVQTAEGVLLTQMRTHSKEYLQGLAATVQRKTEEFTQRMKNGHIIDGLDDEVRAVIKATERVTPKVFPRTFGGVEGRALLSKQMDAVRDSILLYEDNKEQLVAENVAKAERSEHITQYIQSTLRNLRDAIMPDPSIPVVQKVAFFRQHLMYSRDAVKAARKEQITLGLDTTEIDRDYQAMGERLRAQAKAYNIPEVVTVDAAGQLDFFPQKGKFTINKEDGHAYSALPTETEELELEEAGYESCKRTLPLFGGHVDANATAVLEAYQGDRLLEDTEERIPRAAYGTAEYYEQLGCDRTAIVPAHRPSRRAVIIEEELPAYQAQPETSFDPSATVHYDGVVSREYALLETLDLHDDHDLAGQTVELADLGLEWEACERTLELVTSEGLADHLDHPRWLEAYAGHVGRVHEARCEISGVWNLSTLFRDGLDKAAAKHASSVVQETYQTEQPSPSLPN